MIMFLVSGEIDLEIKIIEGLERISEIFRIQLWRESLKYQLNPTQSLVLLSLQKHTRLTQKDLQNMISIDKTTLSKSLKTLEQKTLIERIVDQKDQRKKYIHLTPKGKKIAKELKDFCKIFLPVLKKTNLSNEDLFEFIYNFIYNSYKLNFIDTQKMCFNCRFFQLQDQSYYCKYLEKKLNKKEIQIDCKDYQEKE
jgi:Transcriptional regulators